MAMSKQHEILQARHRAGEFDAPLPSPATKFNDWSFLVSNLLTGEAINEWNGPYDSYSLGREILQIQLHAQRDGILVEVQIQPCSNTNYKS